MERKRSMRKFTYTIKNPMGIHARPAGLLVKKATEFNSRIILSYNDKSVDLKKVMAIMAMEIRQNQTVTVICEGSDEERATSELEEFFRTNL
jgi:phosphocarrier protein